MPTMPFSFSSAMASISMVLLCIPALVASVPIAQVNVNGDGIMRFNVGKREAVAPPITSPTSGAVWTVGQKATVTWYVLPSPELCSHSY